MKAGVIERLANEFRANGFRNAPGNARWRGLRSSLGRFRADRSGSVALYIGLITSVLIGSAVIVFDVGRVAVVKTQMQNAADAAAMAAAAQLDGLSGARDRAEAVANGATSDRSDFETDSGSPNIQIESVTLLQQFTPSEIAASSDADASIVQVTIVPRPVTLFLEPALAATLGGSASGTTNLTATATAEISTIICDPPALMVCNPSESGLDDITDSGAIGKQLLLRDGGNDPSPGNFGLMCPPSDSNCGANTLEDFLAAESTDECTGTTQTTKPGVNFQKVNNGVNSRFDLNALGAPDENIMDYPRDATFVSSLLGDGNWDSATYWTTNHAGDPALPSSLSTSPTRYQIHLYEIGETFGRKGVLTEYPLPDDTSDLVADGYTLISNGTPMIPAAGVPSQTPSTDKTRRIMRAAVVNCDEVGVSGRTAVDTSDMAIIELFITEAVSGSGSNTPIVGEIVRMLTAQNSDTIIANVQLLE